MRVDLIFLIANRGEGSYFAVRSRLMLDFSKEIVRLIEDISKKVPVFSHIQAKRILVSCADARNPGASGIWAQLYPMKYENGHYSIRERTGQKIYLYKTDQIRVGRCEIYYIIYLMMPRFQNLSYFQKLETIFHELYHISPEFDGRLRMIHPRYNFHGPSLKLYDQKVRYWIRYYLRSNPSRFRNRFLKHDFKSLSRKHQGVDLVYIPEPRETLKIMVSRKKRGAQKRKVKRNKVKRYKPKRRGRKGSGS